MLREFQNARVPPCLEPSRKLSRLDTQASRGKHWLLFTGPTNGIEISVLKTR
jgi:hypothetical protein